MVVEGHLSDKTLSVEDIAKELNLSRIQLYRKTKALLNCSVNDYLLQRRMAKAQNLLLEGLHVNEIAEKVGFSSGTYFTAAFRKQFGVTPTVFRKDQLKR
ncbi:CFA/I fimbrial subunit D [compost metagenome]